MQSGSDDGTFHAVAARRRPSLPSLFQLSRNRFRAHLARLARSTSSSSPSSNHETEFTKITSKTALGFVVMGFIGFFVKLIFIVSSWELGSRFRIQFKRRGGTKLEC